MGEPVRAGFTHGRHAGVIAPLFSIPSRSSWGIGEIADLPLLARWLASAGLDFLQLLPINEMEGGQSSPYSALSAMAIDPIFIAVEKMIDFRESGGVAALAVEGRGEVDEARRAQGVQYATVRAAKARAFRAAYDRFAASELHAGSARANDFGAFVEREGWWLESYALFRALHDEHAGRYWREWDGPLRDRDPEALVAARTRLASTVRYCQYQQWIADGQWQRARQACGSVGVFGDFPFMVNGHSADVWARQREFRLDASVGVPPEPGAEEGQDWGFPAYRWDVIAPEGYAWLEERTRRCAELFDAFRVDHLVGFYRTFTRERGGRTFFSPPDEPSQTAQGELLMSLFRGHGSCIIAEDLGIVPDFVRESQARRAVPGLKVLRWEREWKIEGQPFRDPRAYPSCSVAISGTHDTESMADWWDAADLDERRAVTAMPDVRDAGVRADAAFSSETRDALLSALFHAGSDFVLIALPDVFGWRDRINTPSVVSDENWTWRLPWPVEQLTSDPAAIERAAFLRGLTLRSSRRERSSQTQERS
jgi:4-alpha-glucanotransferase